MEFLNGVSKEKYMSKLIVVIILSCLTFSSLLATEIKPSGTVVKQYSSNDSSRLESQVLKSNLELKVAQNNLAQLTLADKINKISVSNAVLANTDISLLWVTSFDGKATAQIQVNGNKYSYQQGDLISDVVVIQKITNNSVVIENTNIHKSQKILVGNVN